MRRIAPLLFFLWSVLAVSEAPAEPQYGKPDLAEKCEINFPPRRAGISRLDIAAGAHDLCRDKRDGPHPEVWSVYQVDPSPVQSATCTDGAWDPEGTLVEADPLELAKQQCNRHNVTLKKDLVECFEKGLLFKTNHEDVSTPERACPKGKEVDVHEITDNAICELSNPTQKQDPGNGQFEHCTAIGPGPSVIPANVKPTEKDGHGCCRVITLKSDDKHKGRPERGFELVRSQRMWSPGSFSLFSRLPPDEWDEHYFAKTEGHEIWMCNPEDTPENVKITHYYCAETSQDLMVEGWKHPEERKDRQGPGWCSVTTGLYDPSLKDSEKRQLIGDLTKALEYLGGPKGILNPHTDPLYPGNSRGGATGPWSCRLKRDAFDLHCSDAEIVSTNQFAHSMGAIAAAVWGIPLDHFGGSVTGPSWDEVKPNGRAGGLKNNCDPVPAFVDFAHPLAIYIKAIESLNTGEQGKGPYRWCNDTDIQQDCVRRDATIVGRPVGPEGCGPNGTECEYAPWCDKKWSPYAGVIQEESGRSHYMPLLCKDIAGDVIKELKSCLAGTLMEKGCLRLALRKVYHDYSPFLSGERDDHGFDDSRDWGGYRVLTKPNWDVPRRRHNFGSIVEQGSGEPGQCENDSMSVPDWYCHIE